MFSSFLQRSRWWIAEIDKESNQIAESMTPDSTSSQTGFYPGSWKPLLAISLLAGTLDALGAVIIYQAEPTRLFRFIASGAFGASKAFSAGTSMVVWGILFHYFIAFIWTAIFFFSYPRLAIARRKIFITGVLYGVFVWIVMNKIVLPLTQIASVPFNFRAALIGVSIIIFAIGLPITFFTRRYYLRSAALRDT
jgi:hypothetical protein